VTKEYRIHQNPDDAGFCQKNSEPERGEEAGCHLSFLSVPAFHREHAGRILSTKGGLVMTILAGTVRRINPRQSKTNCVNCAIATDAMLAGRPASAMRGGPHSIAILEQIFGAKFSVAGDLGEVTNVLLAAGSGSRGIVYGSRSGGVGHVFNAVNQNGVVRFLDGQTGKAAIVSGYIGFCFLRTN
jgi:hypothetical protein